MKLYSWIKNNKEWVFSGIGFAVISLIFSLPVVKDKPTESPKTEFKQNNIVHNYGIDPEKYAEKLFELRVKENSLNKLEDQVASNKEKENIEKEKDATLHEIKNLKEYLDKEADVYKRIRSFLSGSQLTEATEMLASGDLRRVEKFLERIKETSLKVCGDQIYDPLSNLVWRKNIYSLGFTDKIFKRKSSDDERKALILNDIISKLNAGSSNQWRIATNTDIDTLKRFNKETIWAAFDHHYHKGRGYDLSGAYLDNGYVRIWGTYYSDYLKEFDDKRQGAVWLNDYGIWVVQQNINDQLCEDPLTIYPRSEEKRASFLLQPIAAGTIERSNGLLKFIDLFKENDRIKRENPNAKYAIRLADVSNKAHKETRSFFKFDMGQIPEGRFVSIRLVLPPGGGFDGKFSPIYIFTYHTQLNDSSYEYHWEPETKDLFAVWVQETKGLFESSRSIFRNAYYAKGSVFFQLSVNEGGADIHYPSLEVTYIPTTKTN